MKNKFRQLVEEVEKTVAEIPDAAKRGDILANLANAIAIALPHLHECNCNIKPTFEEEIPQRKDFIPSKEEVAENLEKPEKQEEEIKNQTEEEICILKSEALMEKYATEISVLEKVKEVLDEESLVNLINEFAETTVDYKDFITINNITEVTSYLEETIFLNGLINEFELEELNDCVKEFTKGEYKSVDDINKNNIKGFNAYIRSIME